MMAAPVTDKQIQKEVIDNLREYRALKVKLTNLKEREELGAGDLFRPLVENSFLSELKVSQIERALAESLDNMERSIIEMKYLSVKERNDEEIYFELGLKRGKFYEKKGAALKTLATAIGII